MSVNESLLVILAGGRSTRMEDTDKATMLLGGRRMIDIISDRFRRRVRDVVVSGASDWETGLLTVDDDRSGPKGPAGALWSITLWVTKNNATIEAFYTVPVDTPFLPDDLLTTLSDSGSTTVAADSTGLHPTVGYWKVAALEAAFSKLKDVPSVSLHRLASLCDARSVMFETTQLMNINTPEDLHKARKMINDHDKDGSR